MIENREKAVDAAGEMDENGNKENIDTNLEIGKDEEFAKFSQEITVENG